MVDLMNLVCYLTVRPSILEVLFHATLLVVASAVFDWLSGVGNVLFCQPRRDMQLLGLESMWAVGIPCVNGELIALAKSRKQSLHWNAFGSIQSLRPFVCRLGSDQIVSFLSVKLGDATQGFQTTLVLFLDDFWDLAEWFAFSLWKYKNDRLMYANWIVSSRIFKTRIGSLALCRSAWLDLLLPGICNRLCAVKIRVIVLKPSTHG